MVIFAAAFLLAPGVDDGPAEAASHSSDSNAGANQSVGAPSTAALDLAAALAEVDFERLFGGVMWLAAAQRPTPTPAPEPTATPRPIVAQEPAPQAPAPSQPAAPPAAPADPPASCPTASMSGHGLELFNAINTERASAGMAALAAHGCLVYVAQLRSQDMASRGYFSHTSPEGQNAFDLMDANGVPYGWAGENLARNNYPDGETVGVAIRDLMASQGHRDNILSPNYTDLGVAAVNDGAGMWYYTMVFIGPA